MGYVAAAPVHYQRVVRQIFNETFTNRWIDREVSISYSDLFIYDCVRLRGIKLNERGPFKKFKPSCNKPITYQYIFVHAFDGSWHLQRAHKIVHLAFKLFTIL